MAAKDYSKLTDAEKESFETVCNYLIDHSGLVKNGYNPRKEIKETSALYRECLNLQPVLEEHFSRMGWKLKHDNYDEVFLLIRPRDNKTSIKKNQTLFLLALRLIYEEIRSSGQQDYLILTDTGAVSTKLMDFGIIREKSLSTTEKKSILAYLESNNIICKRRYRPWTGENDEFLITPLIGILLDAMTIREMEDRAKSITGSLVIPDEEEDNDIPDTD